MLMPERMYERGPQAGQLKPQTPDDVYEAAKATGYPMADDLDDADKLLIGYEVLTLAVAMPKHFGGDAMMDDNCWNLGRTRATLRAMLPHFMRIPHGVLAE